MVMLKDIRLYTVQCTWKDGHWRDEDDSDIFFRTVAVGRPHFLDRDDGEWTPMEEDFDCGIFYYYEDYAELNQHLKDGDETHHDFIVTKIINKEDTKW
jgi:hypothetical protein